MAHGKIAQAENFAIWCSNACQGKQVHQILFHFDKTFNEHVPVKPLSAETAMALDYMLPELGKVLNQTACERLNAYSVEVLKKSCFLKHSNEAETIAFIEHCFYVIRDVWQKGYHGSQINNHDQVTLPFDPEAFSDGWLRDIRNVNLEFLPDYIEVLSWNGIPTCSRFTKAIEELNTYVINNVVNTHPAIADRCSSSLINKVFSNLLQHNYKEVIEHLYLATDMVLQCTNETHYESLEMLKALIDHLAIPFRTTKGVFRKSSAQLVSELTRVRSRLSKDYKESVIKGHNEFTLLLSKIIKTLKSWQRKVEIRYIPQKLVKVTLECLGNSQKQYTGQVVSVSGQKNRICQVLLNHNGRMLVIKGKGSSVPLDKRIEKVTLLDQCEDGPVVIEKMMARFDFDGEQKSVESVVLPIRAWNCEHGSSSNKSNVVFFMEDSPFKSKRNLQVMLEKDSNAQPTEYTSIPEVLKKNDLPFRKDMIGFRKDIIHFFKLYAEKLLHDRQINIFWPNGKPAKEDLIDAHLIQQLREYVENRGGSFHAQEDSGYGNIDCVVCNEKNSIIIEIKRSIGDYWKEAIPKQIATYMTGKSIPNAQFVMFDFENKFDQNSTDLQMLFGQRKEGIKLPDNTLDIIVICVVPQPSATSRDRDGPPKMTDVFISYFHE